MNKVYLASEFQIDSIVDGPGLRTVIWFQGCKHNCEACHNPKTHSFKDGIEYTLEDIYAMIDGLEFQDGLTFSGGDPFFQPEAFLSILKYAKDLNYNIWSYTGFLYETLLKKGGIYIDILKEIDVLIDGKFDINKLTLETKYRGSYNQRLIDVKSSLKENKVILFDV